MNTNGDDPINQQNRYQFSNQGLTKREYFAALALQGLLASGDDRPSALDLISASVIAADKLIEELNK